MKRVNTMCAALALAALVSANGYAQQSLPRSANGGGPAAGPAPVAVPRHPYAGGWEGTLAMDGAGAPAKIAMSFTVADAAKQSYAGETTIAGAPARTHTNISAAGEAMPDTAAGKAVLPRSAGTAPAAGPAAPSGGEVDNLGATDRVVLLFHTPTKTMLICDEGHRCVDLATLTWEEHGADGRHYTYAATLSAADTITGTVKVTGGQSPASGTFTMKRK